MRSLLLEMLAARHDWGTDGPEPGKAQESHERYDETVSRGGKEYVKHSPTADFLKEHKLRMHFREHKAGILYFLENPVIPLDNDSRKRDLRAHKRTPAAKMTFRNVEYLKAHCDFLTISTIGDRRRTPLLKTLNAISERPRASEVSEAE